MHHPGGDPVRWALLGAGLLWFSDWIHPPAPPPDPLLAALVAIGLAAFMAWLLTQAAAETYHAPIAAVWLAVVAPLLAAATGGVDGERARLAAISIPALIPLLAPFATKPGDVVLGRATAFPWRPVRLAQEDRFRHLLCIGPSGTGKTTTVLAPLLRQDLASGSGVVVIEPKDGELAEICRAFCRAHGRPWREIAPLDPAGEPWNALQGSAPAAAERALYGLGRLQGGGAPASAGAAYYDAVGQSVIRHAVYAIKGALGDDATLADLRDLLSDATARARILARCDDAEVHRYFAGTFGAWRPEERARNVAGILNALDTLLAHPDLRRTLHPAPATGIRIPQVLAEGGVLLVTLPTGELLRAGDALGAFFLAALTAAVFSRPSSAPRPPVFLYVDEFQRFATPGFADFLAMARGYRVGAVLAHQNLAQVRAAGGQPLVETVLANTRTRVVLACDAPDAAALAPAMRCPPERLQSLPFRVAACLLPGGRTRILRLPAPRSPQVAHRLWIRRTAVR